MAALEWDWASPRCPLSKGRGPRHPTLARAGAAEEGGKALPAEGGQAGTERFPLVPSE